MIVLINQYIEIMCSFLFLVHLRTNIFYSFVLIISQQVHIEYEYNKVSLNLTDVNLYNRLHCTNSCVSCKIFLFETLSNIIQQTLDYPIAGLSELSTIAVEIRINRATPYYQSIRPNISGNYGESQNCRSNTN